MNQNRLTKLFILIGVVLYIASLTQKCYCLGSQCGDSITAFLFGWSGVVLLEFGHIADNKQNSRTRNYFQLQNWGDIKLACKSINNNFVCDIKI